MQTDKKVFMVTIRLGEAAYQEYRKVLESEREKFSRANPHHEPPNDSCIVRSILHRMAASQGKQCATLSYSARQARTA